MRRTMLKMSQSTLADALGITSQQLQKYEKGTNRIGAGRLHEIASLLQVPIQFFYEGAPLVAQQSIGNVKEFPPVSEFLSTKDGRALMRAFLQIEYPKYRRLLVNLARELASIRPDG
jgi:transcriptional regulator with XRE-family HTH domain